MKHAEVVIARRAVEEGRGLVVIVNKMDLLRGKNKSSSHEKIMEIVPQEIQTVIPQVWYAIISSNLSQCSLNWTSIHCIENVVFLK